MKENEISVETEKYKIAILGAGIMATALTFPLAENGHEVHLVGTHLDKDIIDTIRKTGIHPNLELKIPESVKVYQLEEVEKAFEGADVAMSGVNSFGVDWVGEQLAKVVKPGMMVFSITKGMQADQEGNLFILPDIIKKYFTKELVESVTWSAVVGPSIAGEVAVHRDTCVVFCGEDQDSLNKLAALFRTDYYHVWTSTDFVGMEVAAATKNIYAFAAGFNEGIRDKNNEQGEKYVRFNYGSAVFAQGQVELTQFMELLSDNNVLSPKHLLVGSGDMFVTSMGGRNVKAGRYVGAGIPFSEVRDHYMKGVTMEGVAAIRVIGAAMEPLTRRGIIKDTDFPLLRHLYDIIVNDQPLQMPWNKFFGGEK
ncbi:2-dehydropantoate 2-reductase N-terminal domain-containing protein [Apibacter raozihei]|uniref:NAD(P)H-dependent glycerol-3-phosphate dehydrogenase n=1 Tax=Apibacter TaxID=1778601 RepID=UPI000FE3BF2D|nr:MULTISPECIES: 2-dehydropantoate 2-reductase N-terminal domain-containing protein [Apibacter]